MEVGDVKRETHQVNDGNGEGASRAIWRQRGRRLVSGLNVCVAVLLAAVLLVIVNSLAARYYQRWDVSRGRVNSLSPKSAALLGQAAGTVRVLVLFQPGQRLYDEVRDLLKAYRRAADANPALTLQVDVVDPDRDLAQVRALAREYDIQEPNVVVFECEGRRRYVDARELAQYDTRLEGNRVSQTLAAFTAEQAFTAALLSVLSPARPVVYVLAGHGERDVADYSRTAGYSDLARALRRDNMDVRPLALSAAGVPEDAAMLLIPGPTRRLSREEVDMIGSYLNRSGRALVMLDPQAETGLEPLLETWGVRCPREMAVGMTLTGRELVVSHYGDHPVTRGLEKISTMFYMPRVVEPAPGFGSAARAQVDRPQVVPLAMNTERGWAEADLAQQPPRYDEGVDRRGPVSVAVAVERGRVAGLNVEIRPTRLVVVGDSFFVSNGALQSGLGGNVDFMLSAVNWLLEREQLLEIAPRRPDRLELALDRGRARLLFLLCVVGLPAVAGGVGALVWWRRRR